MGKIFCVFGKSASGKDTLYKELLNDTELNLKPVVLYTTRPMREGEVNGKNYYFVPEDVMNKLSDQGKIIEHRVYETVFGMWHYFTADDGNIDLYNNNYLIIGTLESYISIKKYYGEDFVVPLYISVDDGVRLLRAIEREQKQHSPAYDEVCRRYLADCKDFSAERLSESGIEQCFDNLTLSKCLNELKKYIGEIISEDTV